MEAVIWLESMRIAMREMRRHPTRSCLTMLGVIFGVGAIIAVVSISQGAKIQIQDQIASIGTNMIIVLPESSAQGSMRSGAGTGNSLSIADGEAIGRECSAVARAATASRIITLAVSEVANWTTEVIGVTAQYLDVRNWSAEAGRVLDRKDIDTAAKVCVLGQTAAKQLFGRTDCVGDRVRIQGTPFLVVGVLAVKGQSPNGSDQDDTIIVPLSSAIRYLHGPDRPKAIVVSATSKETVALAMEQMASLLRQRHKIHEGQVDDFSIKSLEEAARMAEDTSNVLTRLLVAIAAISLLVGGIGIMNIMLVTVMERTREIGIRIALGASRQMIMSQFMVEAMTIAGVGGVLGILAGIGGSRILSQVSGWPAIYSPSLLILPLVFALTVGVIFGLLPARRASRMRPVESLRHE